jgi:hypothetical protein
MSSKDGPGTSDSWAHRGVRAAINPTVSVMGKQERERIAWLRMRAGENMQAVC